MDKYSVKHFLFVYFLIILVTQAYLITKNSFPLNDGGLFWAMSEDLVENNFRLPTFTSYNFDNIPYAYPPAAFYIIGILSGTVDKLQLFLWLPIIFIVLIGISIYLFGYHYFDNNVTKGVITAMVGLGFSESFSWLVMGGGITRGLGLFSSIMALIYILKIIKGEIFQYKNLVMGICWVTVAILSHPESPLFILISTIFLLSYFFKNKILLKQHLLSLSIIAISSAIFSSVWWYRIIAKHGFDVFVSAMNSGTNLPHSLYMLGSLNWQLESPVNFFAVICLISLAVGKERKLFLWIILLIIFNSRSALRFMILPMALLGSDFLYRSKLINNKSFWAITLIIIFSNLLYPYFRKEDSVLSLSKNEISAMEWIRDNANANPWLVITNNGLDLNWARDHVSEWFPVITQRHSLLTRQGYEWKGEDFKERYEEAWLLNEYCTYKARCFDEWSITTNNKVRNVYLGKVDNENYRIYKIELESQGFILAHDNADASVWIK